jgi:hypothetical protein
MRLRGSSKAITAGRRSAGKWRMAHPAGAGAGVPPPSRRQREME